MARLFNGTSDFLQSASTIDLTAFSKIAVACWLWWDAFANDDELFLEFGTTYETPSGSFLIDPNSSSATSFYAECHGNVGASTGVFTRPSAAAWHHYVFNFDKSKATQEVDTIYLDGASQTLTRTDNNNTDNFSNTTLNVMSRNGTSLFGAGRLAELAIWGGNLLSSADATALFNGSKLPSDPSLSIGAATYYWKICGAGSPEQSTLGGVNLTVTGTQQTPHPPNVTASCALAPLATPYLPGQMRGPRQYSFLARTQFASAPTIAPVEDEDGVYVYHTVTW